MQNVRPKVDVVVIGGGIGGLATSLFLAREGKQVVLLERSKTLGGRAQTQERDKFFFNLGPHALYNAGHGIEVLRELGVQFHGAAPPASHGFLVKQNQVYALPSGFFSLFLTGAFGFGAKLEAARLLGTLGKIDPKPLMGTSVSEWVSSTISHADLQDLIKGLFRLSTYANDPERMSAGVALQQFQLALKTSVLYLDGGWQTLVDGLRTKALASGVTIKTNALAKRVERHLSGEVAAVHLEHGEIIQTSTVILATSPQQAAELVDQGTDSSLQFWAQSAIPVKAACLDVALSQLPKPNVTFALGLDDPLYYSVHTAAARLGPEGQALIHVAKYLPTGETSSFQDIQKELESWLDLLQPEWRKVLVHKRFLPNMVVSHWLTTVEQKGTAGRPGPEVLDIPGLFVVGDWVGKEGLLADASLASAKRAAELVLHQARLHIQCA